MLVNNYRPESSHMYTAVHNLTKTAHLPTKVVPREVVGNSSDVNHFSLLLHRHIHSAVQHSRLIAYMTSLSFHYENSQTDIESVKG